MSDTVQDAIANFTREMVTAQGASREALTQLESSFGCPLPEQYKDFLLMSNGAEGFLNESDGTYLSIYSVEDVISVNEVPDVASSYIIFASNGAGEAYAFDRSQTQLPIVNFPFVDWEEITPYGETLLEFLERRAKDGFT